MKLGICTSCAEGVPFEERIRAMAAAGFTCVSLDFEDTPLDREVTHARQVEIAEKYGMEVQAVHLTCCGLTDVWGHTARADEVTGRIIRELRELKELGLTTGVAHTTWGYEAPQAVSEAALDRFRRMAEAAEGLQVRLALENALFPAHHHAVLDAIDSPYVGFCWDSGHENAFTPEAGYPARYGERLMAVHLHDNYGVRDEHNLPFAGTVDWQTKMAQLKKTAFVQRCGLTLEVGIREGDFAAYMERCFDAACRLRELCK